MLHNQKFKRLSFVLKIVERCNINCTYCYFFYGGDESYKLHPPLISIQTVNEISNFIAQACIDLEISDVDIGFHGGEPLLIKPNKLQEICEIFLKQMLGIAKIHFNIQTNGMLINESWINLFYKYKIYVGISLDGPKHIHDKYRIDKKNLGTYDRVIEKIKLMQKSNKIQNMGGIGVLSVINPEFSAIEIYNHFTKELKIKECDFLLPDNTHESLPMYPIKLYEKFLLDLFNEYTKDNDPSIRIRVVNNAINLMLGGTSSVYGHNLCSQEQYPLITINSDGSLYPVDELRVCNFVRKIDNNIYNITLKEFLLTNTMQIIQQASYTYPNACSNCCWKKICGGGTLVSRYSVENNFDNKSVYCDALMAFYAKVAGYLIHCGVDRKNIEQTLDIA